MTGKEKNMMNIIGIILTVMPVIALFGIIYRAEDSEWKGLLFAVCIIGGGILISLWIAKAKLENYAKTMTEQEIIVRKQREKEKSSDG